MSRLGARYEKCHPGFAQALEKLVVFLPTHERGKDEVGMKAEWPTTDDTYLDACARGILKVHGPDAPVFVANRIRDMAERFDVRAAETWCQIRRRMRSL